MMLLNMLKVTWGLLPKLLPVLIVTVLALAVYRLGYSARDHEARAEVAALKLKQGEERLAAERMYSAKLKDAVDAQQEWLTRADEVSRSQAETEKTITAAARDFKKGIDDAVQKDAAAGCVPGLGPNSLYLYRRALGY